MKMKYYRQWKDCDEPQEITLAEMKRALSCILRNVDLALADMQKYKSEIRYQSMNAYYFAEGVLDA